MSDKKKIKLLNTPMSSAMSIAELSQLGLQEVGYIRAITSQEVMEKFSITEGLQPGMNLWALFSASGDPLALSDEHSGVLSNAHDLELHSVSLH